MCIVSEHHCLQETRLYFLIKPMLYSRTEAIALLFDIDFGSYGMTPSFGGEYFLTNEAIRLDIYESNLGPCKTKVHWKWLCKTWPL